MAMLEDEKLERAIIGYHIKFKELFNVIDPNLFSFALPRVTQQIMNDYYKKYGIPPSIDGLSKFTSNSEVLLFLRDISTRPLDASAYKIHVDKLHEMYINRTILNESKKSLQAITSNQNPNEIVRSLTGNLSSIKHPLVRGEVERGWAYEHVKEAWLDYLRKKKDPSLYKEGYPYGIAELDKYTNGGKRKGHIILIYGDTSSGKTRLKANLAYNDAVMGRKVMYITIEDPLKSIVKIWLSRASLLKTHEIENASLSHENELLFKETCERIYKEGQDGGTPLPYVVFWTGTATTANIRYELDSFANKFGYLPEVLYFDYSNEAYPLRDFNNSSERYNFLFSEYRQLVSEYQIPFITSLQQSRTGKQKKKESDFSLDDIGQSHYVAPHCHVVMFIRQSDALSLDLYLQKNRYGPRNKKISLYAAWDIGYIGDRAVLVHHKDAYEALVNTPTSTNEDGSVAESPVNHPNSPSEDENNL
jgi:replicative DNA helicase